MNIHIKEVVVKHFDKFKDLKGIEILLDFGLTNSDYLIRESTIDVLKAVKHPNDKIIIERLISELKNVDPDVRENAVKILGELESNEEVKKQLLLISINDEDYSVRHQGVEALKNLKNDYILEYLLTEAIENDNYAMRDNAAQVIKEIGDTSAFKSILSKLNDRNIKIKKNAIVALGNIEDSEAVEPLLLILKEKNSSIEGYVIEALERLKDHRAIEPLIAILKDESSKSRTKASHALSWITRKNFDFGSDSYEEWQKWWKENKEEFLKKHEK
ncbi:MAG: HEAT repeat domain-containing protein [bacterium]